MSGEMSESCPRHSHGDSWSDPVAQDAPALMQVADAAAEAEAKTDEAAGAAGPEPAIDEAAADSFNDNKTAESTARPAASACFKDADTTGAADAAPVSLALSTRQTSTCSSPPSIPEMQTTRVGGDMQATESGTSHTQAPLIIQQASCLAPDGFPCAKATLAFDNGEFASTKAGNSVTALVSNHVKQVEPGRVDNTAVKQSQNAIKHDCSLNADTPPAPKADRNQTVPSMFQKKRKAQMVELTHQLNRVKKPCVEVIDLVNDDETIVPAASNTPSRHNFVSGHAEVEVILLDGDPDKAVGDASAGALFNTVESVAEAQIH